MKNDVQIAKSFDAVTLRKMGISALLLASGAVLVYLSDNILRLVGAVGIPDTYKPLAVMVATWLVNTGKEYQRGIQYE